MNLNGINANAAMNTAIPATDPYKGIVWYDFFTSSAGRGTGLEVEGGLWKSFKATEMRIYTTVVGDSGNYRK